MEDYEIYDGLSNPEEMHRVEIISQNEETFSQSSRMRGKSFSMTEDEALCKAWLAVSQDPVTGNSQTNTRFWDRVKGYFDSQPNVLQNRTHISLMHCWGLIQKAVNKFCGFLEQVQMRQQSGVVEADEVIEAKRMYHIIQKKHFNFDTCWEILRHSCKWDEIRSTSKKNATQTSSPSTPSTPNTLISIHSDIDLEPPSLGERQICQIGKKAEKESRRKKVANDTRLDDLSAKHNQIVEVLTGLTARSLDREQQKVADRESKSEHREAQLQLLEAINERQKREEEHKIMLMDMTTLYGLQKAYYEDLQRQIIDRMKDN